MTVEPVTPPGLATQLKRAIVGEVRAVFNDQRRGEAPVTPSSEGLFAPGSVIRRVHGDVTTMMVGGVSALLMQMLHPGVLAGVWDHSKFRQDMSGRLRRTARFIALTTYGSRAQAEDAIETVRRIHQHVHGVLPDGTAYSANDPDLLAWVHVTESLCFLDGWRRYGEPAMSIADQDRYFAEFASIALALGADPVPRTRAEAERLMAAMRPALRADARTREIARLVLHQRSPKLMARPVQALTFEAAIDLLPPWARHMHGLRATLLARPLVRVGAFGMAETLRWAFR